MPNTVTVEPNESGNGWHIKLNGEIARTIISPEAPVVKKSDQAGVTYEHDGQTYQIAWPTA
jgi:hypothetical protein